MLRRLSLSLALLAVASSPAAIASAEPVFITGLALDGISRSRRAVATARSSAAGSTADR
jgi:hypothetical protein